MTRRWPLSAIILLTLVGCDRAIARDDPVFDVEKLSWTGEVTSLSVSYSGKGAIVARGAPSDGVYLVALRIIRLKQIKSDAPVDTMYVQYIVADGRAPLSLGDYESRCGEYSDPETCLRSRGQQPEYQIDVVAWTRLNRVQH